MAHTSVSVLGSSNNTGTLSSVTAWHLSFKAAGHMRMANNKIACPCPVAPHAMQGAAPANSEVETRMAARLQVGQCFRVPSVVNQPAGRSVLSCLAKRAFCFYRDLYSAVGQNGTPGS